MTFATPPGPTTLHPAGYFERAQGSRLPTLSETHQLLVPFPLGVLEVLVIRGAALGGRARLRGRRSCRASPWPSRRYLRPYTCCLLFLRRRDSASRDCTSGVGSSSC